ncbi:MAG: hypothetical protein P9M11_05500 [Candidatus Tenebribacter burtonii]|nr:hypothetical protein [Candidatus Tenebribacter burtonii]
MTSTPFILEVLVVGIQLSITICLWFIAILGYKFIPWNLLMQWKSVVSLSALILSYLLGLIYDYLNPTHFHTSENDKPSIPEKVAFIHIMKPDVWKYLNDLSNRLKIARLTMYIWWFMFSGLIICYIRLTKPLLTVIGTMLVTGVIISILAKQSWRKRRKGYLLTIRRRYDTLKSECDNGNI